MILNCWLRCCLGLAEIFRHLNHCEEIFVGANIAAIQHVQNPLLSWCAWAAPGFNLQVNPGGFSTRDCHSTNLQQREFMVIDLCRWQLMTHFLNWSPSKNLRPKLLSQATRLYAACNIPWVTELDLLCLWRWMLWDLNVPLPSQENSCQYKVSAVCQLLLIVQNFLFSIILINQL